MSSENKNGGSRFNVKFNKVVFGLLLIACATLMVLDSFGIGLGFLSDVPAFALVIGAILILWLIDRIVRLRISQIFFPLAFLFMLFEKYIAQWISHGSDNIMNNWLVIFVALLLHAGTAMITPKRRNKGLKFTYNTKAEKTENENTHNASMGSSIIYIDCASFVSENIVNEMGSCQVYFTNIDQYVGGGTVNVTNELGSVKIHVPSGWRIESSISNEMGGCSEPQDKDVGDKSIVINCLNELGAINIVRD